LTLPLLLAGGLGSLVSSSVEGLVRDLPPVTEIEAQFGLRGAEAFRPPVVYDRTNQVPLFQVLHPLARDRRWVSPGAGGLPEHVVNAILAALDPTFWSNPGYELGSLGAGLIGLPTVTLTQRLGNAALLPPPQPSLRPVARALQSALLADELTKRYSKEQILTWYLNSAYFGLWAYGIDAAALTYFGKHAADLTLAESALLAGAAQDPEPSPAQAPQGAAAGNRTACMAELGYISPEQERQALDAPQTWIPGALEAWARLCRLPAQRRRIGWGRASTAAGRVISVGLRPAAAVGLRSFQPGGASIAAGGGQCDGGRRWQRLRGGRSAAAAASGRCRS
jgi:hypothetical protein